MARPLWSGSIQISLVGFAVEIYPATNTTRSFSFHEIDRNTKTRVKRQSVSPGPARGKTQRMRRERRRQLRNHARATSLYTWRASCKAA